MEDKKLEALVKERLTPVDTEALFAEIIDETYEEVQIMGLNFSPSEIVRKLDPVAFRCYMNDSISDLESLKYVAGDYYHAHEVEELQQELEDLADLEASQD